MIKLRQIFFLLLIFGSLNIFAKEINSEVAQKIALKFYTEKSTVRSNANIDYVYITDVNEVKDGLMPLMYIVNFSTGGFVIVSGDDQSVPIIGYAYDGNFDLNNIPSNVKSWMGQYQTQLREIKENPLPVDVETAEKWNYLRGDKIVLDKSVTGSVTPLMDNIHWNQDDYFNELCPAEASGPNGHVYAGCVATAMSMIMYYWRYPLTGIGSHSYDTKKSYGLLSADYGATTYNWNGMQNSLDVNNSMNNAVATLMYQAGVSVDMDYSATGSGAYISTAATSLMQNFGFASDLLYKTKTSKYTDIQWKTFLTSNLDIKRPIIYSGRDSASTSGHAFICDGYEGADYFHFNFGWSGSANGYYYINAITAGGYKLSYYQSAIINIHPSTNVYPYGCSGTKTITDRFGTIEDGSGPVTDYSNNNYCKWLIAPSGIASITLNFQSFNTEVNNDVVIVYDGADETAPVIDTFSGSTLPLSITSKGDKMFIVFKTNSSVTAPGWIANFSTALPVYCSKNVITYTEASGSFSDGSGVSQYNNKTVCKWVIAPPNVSEITLSFSEFKTESINDVVKVYDQNTYTMLASYSGTSLPETLINSGPLYIVFLTSDNTAEDGWVANYSSTTVDVKENTIIADCSLYPNPTSNLINVKFNMKEPQDLVIEVYNILGVKVLSEKMKNCEGIIDYPIDVSNLVNGVYSLNIRGSKDILKKQFIVD